MFQQAKKLLSFTSSQLTLIGIVLLTIIFLIFDFFLPSNYLMPKKPLNKLPISVSTNKTQISISPIIISLSALTPVASGSSFKNPILLPDSTLALYTVFGHIASISDTKDKKGKWLVVQKIDGSFIESVELSKDALLTISTRNQGKIVTQPTNINDLKKGDTVTVSYNINLKNKKIIITGVDIDRTR